MNWLWTAIDYFIPQQQYESFEEINLLRKCRILSGILLFCTTGCVLVLAIAPIAQDEFDPMDMATIPLALLFGANLYLLRQGSRVQWVSWFIFSAISLFILLAVLVTGGLYSVMSVYLLILPLAAAFLIGRPAGLVATGIIIPTIFVLYLLRETLFGQRLMNPISPDELAFVFLGYVPTILLVAALAWLYEQSRLTATLQMKTMLNQLENTQEKLIAARNQAEAANQAKSDFLAIMSHEIRTPLNGVIGMTGLLLDTEQTNEQREFTDTVRNSGESLLTIINEILDFSKIEAGNIELENIPFNLRGCLEETLDLLAVKASEKKIELLFDMPSNVPVNVVGDVARLRQILLNLLSNAVKFTDEGEVLVSVKVDRPTDGPTDGQNIAPSHLAKDGEEYDVQFSVKDSGIGIPKDRLDRLFKAFSQVDASTTRKYGGTGLGLVISKRLSEIMGGTMWVESEEGVGSRFNFSIRLRSTAEFVKAESVNRDDLAEHDLHKLKDMSVLIVDDSKTNRTILKHQLAAWGMVPTAVESGPAAIRLLQQGSGTFSLIVMDMQMPQMDGIETSNKIQQICPQQKIPIVLLTSIDLMPKAASGDYPFAAAITKPAKERQLQNALLKALDTATQSARRQVPSRVTEQLELQRTLGQDAPMRVLLAEDNMVNQKVIQKMMSKNGYRIDIAANGREALEAIVAQPYDLILMDVRMPEMDGIEATRRIREELPEHRQPIIVAVTADALQGDRERLLAAGMDDYLSKPIRPDDLLKLLYKITPLIAHQNVHRQTRSRMPSMSSNG